MQQKWYLPLILTLLLTLTIPTSYCELNPTIYVSTGGNDTNTGENWANAVKTLETALLLSNDNGTIIIDEGIYTQSLTITQNINIKSKNGPSKTIFTNQGLSQSVIYSEQNNINIEAITFQNCSANFGGALYNDIWGTLTCNNCIFTNCTAIHRGGAIENNGKLQLNNCQFKGNSADMGGAILNTATLKASNSTFNSNNAHTGGVIYNFNPECYQNNAIYTLFQNCNFNYNTAKQADIAYTDNCSYSAITFNYSYFNPDNTNKFIGLITNMNQIIPPKNITNITPPPNPSYPPFPTLFPQTTPNNNTNIQSTPITLKNNNTNSSTNPPNPINPENNPNTLVPGIALTLSIISLITTLTLFIKPYLIKTSPNTMNNGVSEQLLGNSIITADMLEQIEFESSDAAKNKELKEITEKIKSNTNCCTCCTSILYILTLLQQDTLSPTNYIAKGGTILEFLLGPILNLYTYIKTKQKK